MKISVSSCLTKYILKKASWFNTSDGVRGIPVHFFPNPCGECYHPGIQIQPAPLSSLLQSLFLISKSLIIPSLIYFFFSLLLTLSYSLLAYLHGADVEPLNGITVAFLRKSKETRWVFGIKCPSYPASKNIQVPRSYCTLPLLVAW